MNLLRRFRLAWLAFLRPDHVFFCSIDPIIARDFPDMPATFRQRGVRWIGTIPSGKPGFFK